MPFWMYVENPLADHLERVRPDRHVRHHIGAIGSADGGPDSVCLGLRRGYRGVGDRRAARIGDLLRRFQRSQPPAPTMGLP